MGHHLCGEATGPRAWRLRQAENLQAEKGWGGGILAHDYLEKFISDDSLRFRRKLQNEPSPLPMFDHQREMHRKAG